MKYKEQLLSKLLFSLREVKRKNGVLIKKLGKAWHNKREYYEEFVHSRRKKTKAAHPSSYPIEAHQASQKTVVDHPLIIGKDRLAVYTCVFGNYDDVEEPIIKGRFCDYYIVTDQIVSPKSKWKQIEPKAYPESFDSWHPAIKNRYFKMHPDVLFPDHQYSLYVDGNIKLITDMYPFLVEMKSRRSVFGLFNHPVWNCIWDMTEVLIEQGLVDRDGAVSQLSRYSSEGFPKQWGLFECSFIMREHHHTESKETMDIWWNEYLHGEKRDQICFPYALWKNGMQFTDVCSFGKNWRKCSRLKEKAHNRPHSKVT